MAGRIEVGQGYVTIIPSLKGIRGKITSELKPAAEEAGKQAGKSIEQGISDGAAKGSKEAAKSLEDAVPKAAETAGKKAGDGIAKGMRSPAQKASDEVAKDVQKRLSDGFSKIGERMSGLGSGIKSSLSWVKGIYSDALGDIGQQISGSSVGKALSGIAQSIGSALTTATGTVKGVVSFVGTAFGGMAKAVGNTLRGIGDVAKAGFSLVKDAASAVITPVVGVFKGLVGQIGSVLGSIGKVVGPAFSAVAKAAGAAMAGAGAAVGAIAKQSLDAYGDFEQLQGGVKLALGDKVWSTVEQRSQQAFSNMQISQNDYLEKVNSMATGLREALGGKGHEQEAADLADRVIRTQADIVSAMGITQEAADNAFSGIMKGNFMMLDNLNLDIKPTKEGMQEVIDKMNEWNATQSDRTATDYQIDNLADCQAALADYVEYMGLSGYATSEGASTIQGSVSKMKAAWTDWVGELGKSDGDMGRVTANLAESVQDVVGNVTPVLANAVGAVFEQMPEVVMTVGPQLGEALVSVLDSATGGMATRAREFARPVTDALMGAFEGLGTWVSAHGDALSGIWDKLGSVGGQGMEMAGAAIGVIADALAGLADGALPIVSAGLDLLSGVLDAAAGAWQVLSAAVQPVAEALAPVGEAISGKLCSALSDLGGWLSSLDFAGFASGVSTAVQGVVDFVTGCLENVKAFFSEVGTFLSDPVGYIQSSLAGMATSTDVVSSSFSGTASDVSASAASMAASVEGVNAATLQDKTASFGADGNVVTGAATTAVKGATAATAALSGKSVTVSASGNVITGGISSTIWGVKSAIDSLYSKTVDVVTRYSSTGSSTAPGQAAGAVIPRHADGFIATKATLTDTGWIGEAGAEAVYSHGGSTGIFPLTNRRFTGPFASEIADQVARRSSGGNTYIINGITVSPESAMARAMDETFEQARRYAGMGRRR